MPLELLEEEKGPNWIVPKILENVSIDGSFSEDQNSYLVSFSGSNFYSGYSNQVFPPINLTTQVYIHNFRAFDKYSDHNNGDGSDKSTDSGTMFLGPSELQVQYSPFIIDGIIRALSIHSYHLSSPSSSPYLDQALDCLGIKQRIIQDDYNNNNSIINSSSTSAAAGLRWLSSFPSNMSFIKIRVGPAEIFKDVDIKALIGGALDMVPLTAGSDAMFHSIYQEDNENEHYIHHSHQYDTYDANNSHHDNYSEYFNKLSPYHITTTNSYDTGIEVGDGDGSEEKEGSEADSSRLIIPSALSLSTIHMLAQEISSRDENGTVAGVYSSSSALACYLASSIECNELLKRTFGLVRLLIVEVGELSVNVSVVEVEAVPGGILSSQQRKTFEIDDDDDIGTDNKKMKNSDELLKQVHMSNRSITIREISSVGTSLYGLREADQSFVEEWLDKSQRKKQHPLSSTSTYHNIKSNRKHKNKRVDKRDAGTNLNKVITWESMTEEARRLALIAVEKARCYDSNPNPYSPFSSSSTYEHVRSSNDYDLNVNYTNYTTQHSHTGDSIGDQESSGGGSGGELDFNTHFDINMNVKGHVKVNHDDNNNNNSKNDRKNSLKEKNRKLELKMLQTLDSELSAATGVQLSPSLFTSGHVSTMDKENNCNNNYSKNNNSNYNKSNLIMGQNGHDTGHSNSNSSAIEGSEECNYVNDITSIAASIVNSYGRSKRTWRQVSPSLPVDRGSSKLGLGDVLSSCIDECLGQTTKVVTGGCSFHMPRGDEAAQHRKLIDKNVNNSGSSGGGSDASSSTSNRMHMGSISSNLLHPLGVEGVVLWTEDSRHASDHQFHLDRSRNDSYSIQDSESEMDENTNNLDEETKGCTDKRGVFSRVIRLVIEEAVELQLTTMRVGANAVGSGITYTTSSSMSTSYRTGDTNPNHHHNPLDNHKMTNRSNSFFASISAALGRKGKSDIHNEDENEDDYHNKGFRLVGDGVKELVWMEVHSMALWEGARRLVRQEALSDSFLVNGTDGADKTKSRTVPGEFDDMNDSHSVNQYMSIPAQIRVLPLGLGARHIGIALVCLPVSHDGKADHSRWLYAAELLHKGQMQSILQTQVVDNMNTVGKGISMKSPMKSPSGRNNPSAQKDRSNSRSPMKPGVSKSSRLLSHICWFDGLEGRYITELADNARLSLEPRGVGVKVVDISLADASADDDKDESSSTPLKMKMNTPSQSASSPTSSTTSTSSPQKGILLGTFDVLTIPNNSHVSDNNGHLISHRSPYQSPVKAQFNRNDDNTQDGSIRSTADVQKYQVYIFVLQRRGPSVLESGCDVLCSLAVPDWTWNKSVYSHTNKTVRRNVQVPTPTTPTHRNGYSPIKSPIRSKIVSIDSPQKLFPSCNMTLALNGGLLAAQVDIENHKNINKSGDNNIAVVVADATSNIVATFNRYFSLNDKQKKQNRSTSSVIMRVMKIIFFMLIGAIMMMARQELSITKASTIPYGIDTNHTSHAGSEEREVDVGINIDVDTSSKQQQKHHQQPQQHQHQRHKKWWRQKPSQASETTTTSATAADMEL